MSAYNSNFKQEMPPPGGYEEIHYKRIPAQRVIGYKSFLSASIVLGCYGLYYIKQRRNHMARLEADWYDHVIAVEPLVRAENDRAFLRQLRHNRNVERDLMKNVPDWKVGTLWGKQAFNNLPENQLPNVSIWEYYAHRPTYETHNYTRPNSDVGLEDNAS